MLNEKHFWETTKTFRIWNGFGFLGVLLFYFPQSQLRMAGEPRARIAKKIDYLGAALSIIGLTLL